MNADVLELVLSGESSINLREEYTGKVTESVRGVDTEAREVDGIGDAIDSDVLVEGPSIVTVTTAAVVGTA
jgi:hypothetical protein